jgi:opacity protein-like surface antigen
MKTAPMVDDQAPLEEINRQFQIDEELRKYHRRLPGSFFIALGGGMFGSTYHGTVNPDSHEITQQDPNDIPATGKPVVITKGYSLANLFQLILPEIGYQVTDRFAMSVQIRFQYTPTDSQGWNTSLTKAISPPTYALAFFLRGQYAFLTAGNFQLFGSGVAGVGQRTFMGYIPKTCDPTDPKTRCTTGTGHSDTISAGPVAFGAGAGMMYHLSRHVALWLEARGMISVGPVLALAEFNGGLAFAYKFDFEKSAAPPPQDTVGGWERPPEEREAPPADAPSE